MMTMTDAASAVRMPVDEVPEVHATHTIREVAAQFHMQPSTLRYYEEQGLLTNVGRTATGQRVYEECHINRLRAICCFKNAGMTIDDLKKFFTFEQDEPAHIDEILELLESRRRTLDEQRRALNEAALHVQRKLHYYQGIKQALDAGEPLPDWKDYKTRIYAIDC
ncbi:MerR family transcriptional regulator [Bifidobacterium myosotis]|uniref:MerR family transcriptional regulator n=2 Tax=Bifidobacterium myosotis TaxID=1630166 RepID=A0A261FQ28_9BIFI|nr:MerR family transcriptional regulator [Bifidobacterium myosotis]